MHQQTTPTTAWATAINSLTSSPTPAPPVKCVPKKPSPEQDQYLRTPPTKYDIAEIKKYYPIMANLELGRRISRTERFVRKVAEELNLVKIFPSGKPAYSTYLSIIERHCAGHMIDQIAAAMHLDGLIVHKAIKHFKEYGIDG